MTMLEARDGDQRSYVEIVDTIEIQSPTPGRDLEQLFRRIVFSVLVSNTDDHLRNHGFLRETTGWALPPAFDLNPNPAAPGAQHFGGRSPRDSNSPHASLTSWSLPSTPRSAGRPGRSSVDTEPLPNDA